MIDNNTSRFPSLTWGRQATVASFWPCLPVESVWRICGAWRRPPAWQMRRFTPVTNSVCLRRRGKYPWIGIMWLERIRLLWHFCKPCSKMFGTITLTNYFIWFFPDCKENLCALIYVTSTILLSSFPRNTYEILAIIVDVYETLFWNWNYFYR